MSKKNFAIALFWSLVFGLLILLIFDVVTFFLMYVCVCVCFFYAFSHFCFWFDRLLCSCKQLRIVVCGGKCANTVSLSKNWKFVLVHPKYLNKLSLSVLVFVCSTHSISVQMCWKSSLSEDAWGLHIFLTLV